MPDPFLTPTQKSTSYIFHFSENQVFASTKHAKALGVNTLSFSGSLEEKKILKENTV